MKVIPGQYVKIVKTAALYSAFFALGLALMTPGPTLLDLQKNVQVDTSRITFIYLARSSSYLLGSLIGGFLFDFLRRKQLLLVTCSLAMSVSAVATPWCRNLETLIGSWVLGGLAMGAIDTGGNVICLSLWGKDGAPYLQALHFVFGVGAFVAPLIAEPFLENQELEYSTNTTQDNSSNFIFTEELSNTTANFSYNASSSVHSVPLVTYPYTIIGMYMLLVAIAYAALSVLHPDEEAKNDESKEPETLKRDLGFTVVVVVITQLIMGVYCGVEVGYGQMLTTFAVKGDLKLSKSVGSFLTALFWGTLTFTRGLSIFLATKFSALTLITADLAIMMVSCAILLVYASTHVEALWAGTFLLALGLASFFPSTLSWLDRYIDLSNKVTSAFVASAALGEMIVPLVVGRYMESNPRILLHIVLGCSLAVWTFTFILWVIMHRKGEKYAQKKDLNVHHVEMVTDGSATSSK